MGEVLAHLSEALASTVAAVGPGVVRVEARSRLPASGIVWSAEGVIVTAHHVVEQDDNIVVGLHDGKTSPATLVGSDPATDLVMLRTQASDLTQPTWAVLDELQVGHLEGWPESHWPGFALRQADAFQSYTAW